MELIPKESEREQLIRARFPKTAPSYYLIRKFWEDSPEFRELIADGPRCFACWEGKQRLERAHIIARVDGGNGWPGNFVLLCKDCHREAPMITDRELFLEWILNHPSYTEIVIKIARKEFEGYDGLEQFTSEDGQAVMRYMRGKKFKFHPRSSLAEKASSVVFMFNQYLWLRDNVFRPTKESQALSQIEVPKENTTA